MRYHPHEYQRKAIQWVLDKPKSGLFLPMGMGKTSVALSAINELMYDYFNVEKVLIIAPIRVHDQSGKRIMASGRGRA